jgi:hypothetical protein
LERSVVRCILIDKTRFKDNSLIIKVLSSDGEFLSGIYFVKKGSPALNYLQNYEANVLMGEKIRFDELVLLERSLVNTESLDQYFLLADLVRQIGEDTAGTDLYHFLERKMRYFFGDYSPSFHVEFLIELISLFGYIPEPDETSAYFDMRSGLFSQNIPSHSDYCVSSIINPAFHFSLGNTSVLRIRNAKERAELFFLLLRFLEIRKGKSIALKSIAVLRDIR